jgi:hypothetical protein
MKKRVLPFSFVVIAVLVGFIAGTTIHPRAVKASSSVHIYRETTIINGDQTIYGVDGNDVVGFSCTYNQQDKLTECFVLTK